MTIHELREAVEHVKDQEQVEKGNVPQFFIIAVNVMVERVEQFLDELEEGMDEARK